MLIATAQTVWTVDSLWNPKAKRKSHGSSNF